jgi:osmotically inducible protein OsmC
MSEETEALHSSAVTWEGPLLGGSGAGSVSLDGGAAPTMALGWQSPSEPPPGHTSPEELISAGLASCFTMMLAHLLDQAGHPARRLTTGARATKRIGGDFAIKRIALSVRGEVPGLNETALREAAERARRECPAANALTGVEIELDVALA